jgi:hypothetical protein
MPPCKVHVQSVQIRRPGARISGASVASRRLYGEAEFLQCKQSVVKDRRRGQALPWQAAQRLGRWGFVRCDAKVNAAIANAAAQQSLFAGHIPAT